MEELIMSENEENIISENTVTEIKVERPQSKKKPIFGYVNCDQLNLRSEADKDSDVLFVLSKDEPVVLDSTTPINGFYKVTTHNLVGFCVKEFITIK